MPPENEPMPLEETPAEPAPVAAASTPPTPLPDARLYVPNQEGWEAKIKLDTERVYCYAKLPGEEYFHLILNGEIFLQGEIEKYCLRCALRIGVATQDRLFWQNRVGKRRPPAV
jgi:hypothetical protein